MPRNPEHQYLSEQKAEYNVLSVWQRYSDIAEEDGLVTGRYVKPLPTENRIELCRIRVNASLFECMQPVPNTDDFWMHPACEGSSRPSLLVPEENPPLEVEADGLPLRGSMGIQQPSMLSGVFKQEWQWEIREDQLWLVLERGMHPYDSKRVCLYTVDEAGVKRGVSSGVKPGAFEDPTQWVTIFCETPR